MHAQAVRGAVQIPTDSRDAIEAGVQKVIGGILEANRLKPGSLVSIQFTVTDDLLSMNPASALRTGGYRDIPLFCSREPEYPGALPRMIRALVTFNTRRRIKPVPVYLDGAEKLRPDLFA